MNKKYKNGLVTQKRISEYINTNIFSDRIDRMDKAILRHLEFCNKEEIDPVGIVKFNIFFYSLLFLIFVLVSLFFFPIYIFYIGLALYLITLRFSFSFINKIKMILVKRSDILVGENLDVVNSISLKKQKGNRMGSPDSNSGSSEI